MHRDIVCKMLDYAALADLCRRIVKNIASVGNLFYEKSLFL